MKHDPTLYELAAFLSRFNINLSGTQLFQLQQYQEQLQTENIKHNLVSKNDINHLIERHFLPSFYYAYVLQSRSKIRTNQILDLGTGGGLPGIILAIFFKNSEITLLDSNRKKMLFLRSVIRQIGIKAELICDRAEQALVMSKNAFDVITARAVASLTVLQNWSAPAMRAGASLLTLKGSDCKDEIKPIASDPECRIEEIQIEQAWLDFSDYLKNKVMIKMELKNDQK